MSTVLVSARGAAARARLEGVVAGARGLRLVSAAPGLSLHRRILAVRPDVVLVDLEGERLESALGGLHDSAGAALVALAEAPRRLLAGGALERGLVRAVLPRDAAPGEIVAAIEAVAAGLVALHPAVLAAATVHATEPARLVVDAALPLTAREIEVLSMLAEGLGNKIIAARLGISAHTAKFHVASIMTKLGAGSRTEAVTLGLRRGLLTI